MSLMYLTKLLAKKYKKYKDEGRDYMIDDEMMKIIAEGAYVTQGGSFLDDDIEIASKPYFDYLKYGNKPQQQEEVKEEPIMIEDNNYSIVFDHEVDTSDSIQMIEELYNKKAVEEVDSDDVINIVNILSNKNNN